MIKTPPGKTPTFKAISAFIAIFFIALSLSAKIPSSKCHCQDPVKSKQEACPFGALRTLTFIDTPGISPISAIIALIPSAPLTVSKATILANTYGDAYQARDPPR